MIYNPPQYSLDHLASLKVGDKAVLLEPIQVNTGYPLGDCLLIEDPWKDMCDADYTAENALSFGAEYGQPLTLPSGTKIKVLSVEPVRSNDITLAQWTNAGIHSVDYVNASEVPLNPYPGAWERNDWFWAAEVEVTT